ncbi:unnamed protein product [Cyclocybe aegerita]|uniref:F-box domain-containing protein n=1 Tax=Cyclocybe aegerita TaxID=1973307 RepID=A0A8S0WHH1_CYCAE|nr:unnamed protein product [Cyclocybe aegerita]
MRTSSLCVFGVSLQNFVKRPDLFHVMIMERGVLGHSVDELLAALQVKLDKGDDGFSEYLSNVRASKDRSVASWKEKCSERRTQLLKLADVASYRSNLSCPINRLPFEIFGAIVLLLLPPDSFMSNVPDCRGTAKSVMAVTHVCHQWRMSTLNIPQLWASIPLDKTLASPKAIGLTFLQRSRPLPVSLFQEFTARGIEHGKRDDLAQFYLALVQQASRIESIDFRGKFHRGGALQIFREALPSIKSLRLDFHVGFRSDLFEDSDNDEDEDEDEGADYSPLNYTRRIHALRDLSPSLRRLHLVDFGWWVYPPDGGQRRIIQFPVGLTHLYLVGQEDFVSPSEVLDVLQSLTSLEVLHLEDIYHPHALNVFSSRRVEFKVIRMLRLRMNNTYTFGAYPHYLLPSLSLPTTAEVIWTADISRSMTPGSGILAAQLPPPSRLALVTKVIVRCGDGNYFMLSGDILVFEHDNYNAVRAYRQLAVWKDHLPNVTSIGLSSIEDCRGNFIVLQSFRSVEHLELYTYHAVHKLVLALESEHQVGVFDDQQDAIPGCNPEPWLLCPNLGTVTVYTQEKDVRDPVIAHKLLRRRMARVKGFPLQLPESGLITRHRPAFGTSYTINFRTGDMGGVLNQHGLTVDDVWRLE